ncbi:MAG: DUF885 family protein [Pseudomonadota bacterium]
MKNAGIIGALALCLALSSGCAKKPDAPTVQAATQAAASSAWTKFVNDWIESDLKAQPQLAVVQGRHEYDGLLPDWSEAGLTAEKQRLKDWRAKTAAVDAAPLPAPQQFEREYLLAVIDGRLFWLESADWPHRNPTWYYLDPAVYLDRPYADIATRMQGYTRWASNIPTAAAQIKANLKAPLPKAFIDIGMYTFGPLADFLKKDVVQAFKGVGDAAAQAEFARQNAAAAAALADLQKYMQGLRKTQTQDFALGPELFAKMLHDTRARGYAGGRDREIRHAGPGAQRSRARRCLQGLRTWQKRHAMRGEGRSFEAAGAETSSATRASSWWT